MINKSAHDIFNAISDPHVSFSEFALLLETLAVSGYYAEIHAIVMGLHYMKGKQ